MGNRLRYMIQTPQNRLHCDVAPQECSRRRSPASAMVAPDCPIKVAEVGVNENTPIAARTRRHLSLSAHSAEFYGSLGRESLVSENVCCSDSVPRGHDAWHRFQSTCHRRVRVKPRRGRRVRYGSRCLRHAQGCPSKALPNRRAPTRPQLRIRPDFWLPA